ncbi:type II toxin-antitoxin system VapC family toxin [Spiribacter halobius]|uniref:PIN domain nuclease n=1 Tax=Sediminicurvatus halobius TaxID=2182432 RepID=A0A2U2MXI9_9GAMM|nr:type II toxin-antitoxin system VapC family toxin [Spiribacter halobius]PWG61610.1 PIN domain nuclease [Spiribacter halobius]UEX77287.1 type II toxin-antitoxin system VapC family toxin [Spiribacter halobius]
MRRLLLDTHTFLWWLSADPSLGERARAAIADPRNQVFVSAATGWEIAIKRAIGKLCIEDEDLDSIVEEEGFNHLPITFHGTQAGTLPQHHKDPFDRMLVAQAQAEGLTILTADTEIPKYGVQHLPAHS